MWDVEYDVVVIGSGFAGLCAAIEAKNRGASVVVIEKMPVPGGNSSISGGLVAVGGSPLQKRQGIEDSPEALLRDMMKVGSGINHPDLARTVVSKIAETLQWTIEYLGVEYKPALSHLGGHSVPRTYNTVNSSGSGIVRPLLKKCRELEIPIQMRCCLNRLIPDENGDVVGAEIFEGYIFPNSGSGNLKRIGARKAVILATGGFSQDISFRTIQDPRLTEEIESTNQPGATAEALIEALRVGATPVHLSSIQLGPWASGDEKGFGVGSMFSILAGFPFGIMVDADTGQRFVNELEDRKLRVDAMLTRGRAPIAIVDEGGVRHASTLKQCLKRGVVKQFDSLEALAEANAIPLEALKETVLRYNAAVEKGVDEEFNKPLSEGPAPLVTPPFYAIRLSPKVHHCMGGVRINTGAQVIDLKTNEPIPGFYAAGEVTGGVHGASRLGSNAIAECLVFGRIAGTRAAQEPSRS